MPLKQIKNIHGGTLDALGEAIIRGDYQPGEKLPPEQRLCEMLGVSRTSVREAVKALVAKGLISTGPKIGTVVLSQERWNWFDDQVVAWQARIGIPERLLSDLLELRAIIEPHAVRLAAERATPDEIDELEQAYRGMKAAVESKSEADYIVHDYAFHLGLLRASHNQLVLQMGRAMGSLLREIFRITTRAPDDGTARSLPEHLAIVDAIRARNGLRAFDRSVSQIDAARRDVANALALPVPRKRAARSKAAAPATAAATAPARTRRRA